MIVQATSRVMTTQLASLLDLHRSKPNQTQRYCLWIHSACSMLTPLVLGSAGAPRRRAAASARYIAATTVHSLPQAFHGCTLASEHGMNAITQCVGMPGGPPAVVDCAGVPGGSAAMDVCGMCSCGRYHCICCRPSCCI